MKNQILHDIRRGIISDYKKILVFVIVPFISSLVLSGYFKENGVNLGDLILWNFRGMQYFDNSKTNFVPNGYWLGINCWLYICIGNYISKDHKHGWQYLIRCGKKTWWLSKSIYCMVEVMLAFIMQFAGILIGALVIGKDVGFDYNITSAMGYSVCFDWKSLCVCLIDMILTAQCICLIFSIIVVACDFRIGCIVVLGLMGLTIYSTKPCLITDALMLLRYNGNMFGTIKMIILKSLSIILIIKAGIIIVRKRI